MRTDLIRAQISAAWREEASSHAFAKLVRQQLSEAGAGPVPQDSQTVGEIVDGWRLQLENVPELIDALREAAAMAEVSSVVEPVLQAAEGYFLDENDVLPDSHGVLGLLDDMYLTLSLIHAVSERHRSRAGRALMDADLKESIAAVRPLFRSGRLAALDERIQASLRSPDLSESIARLSALASALSVRRRVAA